MIQKHQVEGERHLANADLGISQTPTEIINALPRLTDTRQNQVPRRFFEPDTANILVANGYSQEAALEIANEVAWIREQCHRLNVVRKALLSQDEITWQTALHSIITSQFPRGSQIWDRQVATPDPTAYFADFEDLPKLAQDRIRSAHAGRATALWPAFLLDSSQTDQTDIRAFIERLINRYEELTKSLEIHWSQQNPEKIPLQRVIRWQDRELIMQIALIRDLTNDNQDVLKSFFIELAKWKEELESKTTEELQNLVAKKVNRDEKKIAYMIEKGLWDSHSDLIWMCTPRELRMLTLTFHGLFENTSATAQTFDGEMKLSGYNVGQTLMVIQGMLRGFARSLV